MVRRAVAWSVVVVPELAYGNLLLPILGCLAQLDEGQELGPSQRDMPCFVDSYGRPTPFWMEMEWMGSG